jgi:hypothetical protein
MTAEQKHAKFGSFFADTPIHRLALLLVSSIEKFGQKNRVFSGLSGCPG